MGGEGMYKSEAVEGCGMVLVSGVCDAIVIRVYEVHGVLFFQV